MPLSQDLIFKLDPVRDASGVVVKSSTPQRLIWGWGSVTTIGGEPVVDRQGDIIPTETMQKAVHAFMGSRLADTMHSEDDAHEIVDSLVVTKDLAAAMGWETDREGWFIGMRVSPEVWPRVESGELLSFSIAGSALVEYLDKHAATDEGEDAGPRIGEGLQAWRERHLSKGWDKAARDAAVLTRRAQALTKAANNAPSPSSARHNAAATAHGLAGQAHRDVLATPGLDIGIADQHAGYIKWHDAEEGAHILHAHRLAAVGKRESLDLASVDVAALTAALGESLR